MKNLLPWETAKAALKPDIGTDEQAKRLDRLGFWRSLAGFVAVVVLSVDYRSVEDLVGEPGGNAASSAFLALAAAPVFVAVVFLASPTRYRPDLRAGVRKLLSRIAIAAGTVVPPVVLVFVLNAGDVTSRLPAPVILVVVLAAAWFLVYFLCVVYWAARTVFWIGEFHPMLAPVVASLIVCALTVSNLVEWNTDNLPTGVWLMIVGGGLVSTLVLAAAEYRHLRESGIRLRTGPNRPAHTPFPTDPH